MKTLLALMLLLVGCGGARPAPAQPGAPSVDGEALDRLVTDCDAGCPHGDRLALALRLLDRAAALRAESDGGPDSESKLRQATEDEARAAAWLEALASDPALPPALLDDVLGAQLGSSDEATQLRVAQRIVHELPPSALVAEGWLWIGERAFLEADLEAAGRAYERVIALPEADPRLRTYARYKLAWVSFNLGDAARACALFMEVASEEGHLADQARQEFLTVLVQRGLSAEEERRAIASLARTPTERAELEARYALLLDDAGYAERAAAFRAAP